LFLVVGHPDRLTVAGGAGQDGLLVTRGHAIETLARATHFVFDKTGTLTTGRMHLVDTLPTAGLSGDECLALAAALEHASEHPLANALRQAFSGDLPQVGEVRNEPGRASRRWLVVAVTELAARITRLA
jgi:Cu2+-exporting ATPase